MPVVRLFAMLAGYYLAVVLAVAAALWAFPALADMLPIGHAQALIAQAGGNAVKALRIVPGATLGTSLVWLCAAVFGALLTALPVSWVYMRVRAPQDYDQSLIDTIVVLPLVVTGIVTIVQNSLALSFSLAGIAGAARYRNTLKSSGDLLFILLAIGIGLAAGIGALELALVTSAAFNLCFVALWAINYGERADMKRFLGTFEHGDGHERSSITATTATVTEVTERFDVPGDGRR